MTVQALNSNTVASLNEARQNIFFHDSLQTPLHTLCKVKMFGNHLFRVHVTENSCSQHEEHEYCSKSSIKCGRQQILDLYKVGEKSPYTQRIRTSDSI